MNEHFEMLRTLTLATIKQAQNLHVLLNVEHNSKIVITKGRACGFIADGIFYVTKEFSKGGAYNNAVIDTEMELVKSFYGLTQIVSENDINDITSAADKVDKYLLKIIQTEDLETKQIILNEALATLNASKIFDKETMQKKLQAAAEGKHVPLTTEAVPIKPPVSGSPLVVLLEQIKSETDALQVQETFDKALEFLETAPADLENKMLFLDIKKAHAAFFAPKSTVTEEKKTVKVETTKEPAKKVVAKKAAPVKKLPAKKSHKK